VRIEPNQWTFVLAKLYFHYASMNAGKSTLLLQASYNYEERGMRTLLLTAALDDRAGHGRIASRIGLGSDALTFTEADDLYDVVQREVEREVERESEGRLACVFVDEAQFLSEAQVWQLARVVDRLNVPVMTYGLRTDFRGELFPGSKALLAIADSLREIRTICFCGKKATMVVRVDAEGKALSEGAQIDVGGNDTYVPDCREHWMEKTGRRPDRG